MDTSASRSFLSEILSGQPISLDKIAFFRARLQSRLYDVVINKFLMLEREGKITRAILARRIGKNPAQITRLLGSPGNWTTDTTSDLLLGMGEELEASSCSLSGRVGRNYQHPDWVNQTIVGGGTSLHPLIFSGTSAATTVTSNADHSIRIASTA